jgi:hypothetical protein
MASLRWPRRRWPRIHFYVSGVDMWRLVPAGRISAVLLAFAAT